jgi:hypothetical protein
MSNAHANILSPLAASMRHIAAAIRRAGQNGGEATEIRGCQEHLVSVEHVDTF